MRNEITQYLTQHPRSSRRDIAAGIGEAEADVQMALCVMLVHDHAAQVGRSDGLPVYCTVTIGACDWCGVVDHHLVEGECPTCRRRPRPVDDSAALGAEADVRHVDLHPALPARKASRT